MKLIIASNNKNKIEEIKNILSDTFDGIFSQREAGYFDEVEENGLTFAENSYVKAKATFDKKSGYAVLADDSGLSVDALGGAPGVKSARFSGVHGDDNANNEKLLSLMKNEKNRKAAFVCAITLLFPDGRAETCDGRVEGEIAYERAGEGGFGYDPLFFSYDLQKTFGEATQKEKNEISHRGRALQNLKAQLLGEAKNGKADKKAKK